MVEPAELGHLNNRKLAGNLGGVSILGGDYNGCLPDCCQPVGGRDPCNDSGIGERVARTKSN
eukprot:12605433-Alexandrium_andersonii.AAC.1